MMPPPILRPVTGAIIRTLPCSGRCRPVPGAPVSRTGTSATPTRPNSSPWRAPQLCELLEHLPPDARSRWRRGPATFPRSPTRCSSVVESRATRSPRVRRTRRRPRTAGRPIRSAPSFHGLCSATTTPLFGGFSASSSGVLPITIRSFPSAAARLPWRPAPSMLPSALC